MSEKIRRWIRKGWWGALVAYFIAVGICWGIIWYGVEPLGQAMLQSIQAKMTNQGIFLFSLALLMAAHVLLLFMVREWYVYGVPEVREKEFDFLYEVEQAKSFYDAISSEYDQRNSTELLNTHRKIIEVIGQNVELSKDSWILDLGGGTGKLVAEHFFEKKTMHWSYVDSSGKMAEVFSKNFRGQHLNVLTHVEDIDSFLRKTPDRKYNIILLSLVLTSMKANPEWDNLLGWLDNAGCLVVADIESTYTSLHPYYAVKVDGKVHALRPRPIALAQVIQETNDVGFKLESAYPVLEEKTNYSFIAVFKKK